MALLLGAAVGAKFWPQSVLRRALGAGLGASLVALAIGPGIFYFVLLDQHLSIEEMAYASVAQYFLLCVLAYVGIAFCAAFVLTIPAVLLGRGLAKFYLHVAAPLTRPMRGTESIQTCSAENSFPLAKPVDGLSRSGGRGDNE